MRRLEEAAKILTASLGPDHPNTITTMANLGETYRAAGQIDKAIPFWEQAGLGLEKRKFVHPNAKSIIDKLVAFHEEREQYAQAEVWQRKWLAVEREKSGTDSIAYAVELARLGRILLRLQRWAEAEPVIRECLTIRHQKEPDAWSTFHTESLLGVALLGQAKYADAEPLLLQGYQGMKSREATIPKTSKARTLEALERLVELYEEWGKEAETARWRKELEDEKARQK